MNKPDSGNSVTTPLSDCFTYLNRFQCVRCPFKTTTLDILKAHHNVCTCSRANFEVASNLGLNYIRSKCDLKTVFRIYYKLQLKYTQKFENSETETVCKVNRFSYRCPYCKYLTYHKRGLMTHLISKHTNPEDMIWYDCSKCEFKTRYKNCLTVHLREQHTDPAKIRWYQCDKCPFKNKRLDRLRYHKFYNHNEMIDMKQYRSAHNFFYDSGANEHAFDEHDLIKLVDSTSNLASSVKSEQTPNSTEVFVYHCEKCSYENRSLYRLRYHKFYTHGEFIDIKEYRIDNPKQSKTVSNQNTEHALEAARKITCWNTSQTNGNSV